MAQFPPQQQQFPPQQQQFPPQQQQFAPAPVQGNQVYPASNNSSAKTPSCPHCGGESYYAGSSDNKTIWLILVIVLYLCIGFCSFWFLICYCAADGGPKMKCKNCGKESKP